jgi:LAS superfamily LD-carboxypeptidase LdcB
MFNSLELTGRSSTHVRLFPELNCTLHGQTAAAARALRDAARADGIELTIVSSFRDFDRQLKIWNAKFAGQRPLLDRAGQPLARAALDSGEAVEAILIWSALPGASRHHWGTDLDVIDRATVGADYRPLLVPSEFEAAGPFARLNAWLGENMARFGFFRPYTTDRGGVQPEPWHLSFAPLAQAALGALSVEVLHTALAPSAIEGRDEILARLPAIYSRYVTAIDPPPGA